MSHQETYDVEISVADLCPTRRCRRSCASQANRSAAILRHLPISNSRAHQSTQGHNAGQDTISVGAVGFLTPPIQQLRTNQQRAIQRHRAVYFRLYRQRPAPSQAAHAFEAGLIWHRRNQHVVLRRQARGESHEERSSRLLRHLRRGSKCRRGGGASVRVERDATPTDIKNALISSAKQNPVNGQKPGTWDPQAGFGLIDGLEAVRLLDPNFVVADIGRIVPDSVTAGRMSSPSLSASRSSGSHQRSDPDTREKQHDESAGRNWAKLTTDDDQTFNLKNLGRYHRQARNVFPELPSRWRARCQDPDSPGNPGLNKLFRQWQTDRPGRNPGFGTEIDLSWTDNTSNDSGFVVTRGSMPTSRWACRRSPPSRTSRT